MKKSLLVSLLTLTLFIGILSTPAMAYDYSYCNQGNTNLVGYLNNGNRYRITTISCGDVSGMLIKSNVWFDSLRNRINQQRPSVPDSLPDVQPEEPAATPEVKPEEPTTAPEAKPEEPAPAPQPKPEQPAPAPQPEPEQPAPAPKPEPEQPTPAPEVKPEQPAPAPKEAGDQQSQMLDMVNQERAKADLKPLTWDGNLASVAQVKAKDMVDNSYFDHNSPTYGSPFEMMKKYGITYRAAGENLAGSSSVERAHVGLMNSEGHRKNILNPNFTHIGIGVEKSSRYGYVYVQMFIGK